MDSASHFALRLDAQELADLERATGLLLDDEEAWSAEDYDVVIAYLRRKAEMPPVFSGIDPSRTNPLTNAEGRRYSTAKPVLPGTAQHLKGCPG